MLIYLPKKPFFSDIKYHSSIILFKSALDQYLKEFIDMASLAEAKMKFDIFENGFKLLLSGFNHKFANYLKELANRISSFCLVSEKVETFFKQQFEIIKQKKIEELDQMIKAQPYKQYNTIKPYVFQPGTFSSQELLGELEKLSMQDYLEIHKSVLKQVYLESLISGNLTQTKAIKLETSFINNFKDNGLFGDLPLQKLNHYRVVNFYRNQSTIYEYGLENEKEKDNLISLYFQLPQGKAPEYINMILRSFLKTVFFDEMRTQKQFGYIVAAFSNLRKDISAFSFLIQSNNKLPSELTLEIFDFIIRQRKRLEEFTDSKFEELKKGVMATFQEEFHSLEDQSKFYFGHIENHTYDFAKKEDAIKEIQQLNKSDLMNHFDSLFFLEKKILEFHFVNKSSRMANLEHIQKRQNQVYSQYGAIRVKYYNDVVDLQNDHELLVDKYRKSQASSEL